ncbi:MAG: hypothetical protein H8E98_06160 [Bacteroidetes bacterium]|nr:hypothetical protein [Bacteroidota bacterium]
MIKLKRIVESDPQTYKRLSFIRSSIGNIRRTLRQIDWTKATDNEKREIKRTIQQLVQIIK